MTPHLCSGLFLILVLAWSSGLHGRTVHIDARNASEANPSVRYLIFSANEDRLGHAFVAWAGEDPQRRISYRVAFGLYPDGANPKAAMRRVPGSIVEEILRGNHGLQAINLQVRVTDQQYRQAEQILQEWTRRGSYQLLEEDCVTFLSAIAASIHLTVPDRRIGTLRPVPFVNRLIALNQQ